MKNLYITENDYGLSSSTIPLLGENGLLSSKREYVIPLYQRPYSWNMENIEDFFTSLTEAFSKRRNVFFGTIQINEKDGKLEVVDGQQRIITFRLLLACLDEGNQKSDFAKIEYSNVNDSNTNKLLRKALDPDPDCSNPETPIGNIRRGKTRKKFLEDNKNIFIRNLLTIKYLLREEQSSDFDFASFRTFIEDHVYFVELRTEEKPLPQIISIFDSINRTGMDLNTSDIFKLQFYSYLGENDEALSKIDSEYKLVSSKNESFSKPYDISYSIDAFRYYLYSRKDWLKEGESWKAEDLEESREGFFQVAFGKLSPEKREDIFTCFSGINRLMIDIYENCWGRLQEIELSENQYFQALQNDEKISSDEKWIFFSFQLCWMTRYSAYWKSFFALAYSIKEVQTNLSIPEVFKEATKLFKSLLILFIRASVTYDKATHEIKHLADDLFCNLKDCGTFKESISKIDNKSKGLINDFESGLRFNLYENVRRRRLIETLYSIFLQLADKNYNSSIYQQLIEGSNLDIDHICPKTEFENNSSKIPLFNGVGNLCYLPSTYNRSAHDIQPSDKTRFYEKDDANKFACCKQVLSYMRAEDGSYKNWDENTVEKYSKKICDDFTKMMETTSNRFTR